MGSELAAVDPSGCGTDPCPTLWVGRAPVNGTGGVNGLAVDNGIVYTNHLDRQPLCVFGERFGAAICAPLWTAAVGTVGLAAPSIANGVVYAAGVDDGRLSRSTPTAVAQRRVYRSGTAHLAHIFDAPAIAAGTVYSSRDDGTLTAYRVPRP